MASITPSEQKAASGTSWARWGRYFVLGVAGNLAIWGMTLTYLKKTPRIYTSDLALVLPTGTSGVTVNLPDIGQATSSSGSPFGNTTSDPRENYKYIATSDSVLEAAADRMGLPAKQFGQPRVKLLNNTTIMEIQITGKSPEQARQKAKELYRAIVERLTDLRNGEMGEREQVTQNALKASQIKLAEAQQRLSDYKAQSGLSSPDQVKNLATNIELLRKFQVETIAQQQQSNNQLRQLAQTLGIQPREAADAFLLQVDQPYQDLLKNYKEATTALVIYQSKWGENHPLVITEKARLTATITALIQRGEVLLGRSLDQNTLNRLTLDSTGGGARALLFQQLVTATAEQQGLRAQVVALSEQIQVLEQQLAELAQKESVYDRLSRDLQVAEAVFASTLAKSDLRKGDIFSSYPLVQLLKEPSLPDAPSAPKTKLVIIGALAGSIFSTTGLTLLWWRKRLVKAYIQLYQQKRGTA